MINPPNFCSSSASITLLQAIAGPFAQDIELIWSQARLGEYFCATNARRHIWHACLSSEFDGFRHDSEGRCETTYTQFAFMRGKDLIAQAYGCRPRGLLNVLARLGLVARSASTYRSLVRLLDADLQGAKLLRHSKAIDDRMISIIASMPETLLEQGTVLALADDRLDPDDAPMFFWVIERLLQKLGLANCEKIMASRSPVESAFDAIIGHPFPEPPWEGTEKLKPLRSAEELRDAASSFGNCLMRRKTRKHAILNILQRTKYYYRWHGRESALIELVSVLNCGWFVSEIKGRHNQSISNTECGVISEALSQSPSICNVGLGRASDMAVNSEFVGWMLAPNIY